MRIPGTVWLQHAAQRAAKRLVSRGLILMYHRVDETSFDPWSLSVSPKHFAEHLQVVRRYGRPLELQRLVDTHRNAAVPRRAVVVTFDDGYADNLYQAKPLLEQYQIPATVFVTTGQIGDTREFWWDELERLVLRPSRLPERLCLRVEGKVHEWDLGEAANYSAENHLHDRRLLAWEGAPGSRLSFYYSVWNVLRPASLETRQQLLEDIRSWANDATAPRPAYRALTPEEIRTLRDGGLVEVGAHTVTHSVLPAQPSEVQQCEIERSKTDLTEILDRPVTSFSYPFGDYTSETISLVRHARFTCACSTVGAFVWRESDPFQLPRFEVRDWSGDEFERRLLRWLRV